MQSSETLPRLVSNQIKNFEYLKHIYKSLNQKTFKYIYKKFIAKKILTRALSSKLVERILYYPINQLLKPVFFLPNNQINKFCKNFNIKKSFDSFEIILVNQLNLENLKILRKNNMNFIDYHIFKGFQNKLDILSNEKKKKFKIFCNNRNLKRSLTKLLFIKSCYFSFISKLINKKSCRKKQNSFFMYLLSLFHDFV
ncbi:hypothetical protein [Guillardia theta]|uniref:Uncharacterized protein n=1 Tax=Guillardia theta TaxID=55529 RepID=Q9AVX0_GUITH|nr:hypothetical protein GTHECHR2183 [Guillardia theta]CAC27101.1 hypothetical protein [Guillardia theta]